MSISGCSKTMPISLPTSYDYEGPMDHPQPSNPSSPDFPIDFYIEMQERHYEDLREYELEQAELERQNREQRRREERLHRRQSRAALRHRHQNNQVENEQQVDSPIIIICECGYAAVEDVISIGVNIGRRYFRCHVYPTGCTFWQWIDDPFPSRAADYANELQHQLTTLQTRLVGFQNEISRLNDQFQGLNIRRQN